MSSFKVQNHHIALIWYLSDESDKGTDTLYLIKFSLSGIQILKFTCTTANSCSCSSQRRLTFYSPFCTFSRLETSSIHWETSWNIDKHRVHRVHNIQTSKTSCSMKPLLQWNIIEKSKIWRIACVDTETLIEQFFESG